MTAAPGDAPLVFHLIPHTHWDREWYLGAGAFGARLVPLLDDLLDRLARDPAYRTFLLDGQTVLLADYLAVRPEQGPLVSRLAEAGRLQLGPWYVLADELVPSGESLARNLLLGLRDVERWTGNAYGPGRLAALYSPDMFGHPAALPLLAREFGLVQGALWRGLHPDRTGGRDLVWWTGAGDGALLLYHLPRDGYEVGAALPSDRAGLERVWPPLRRRLVARAATRHVAVLIGADHHAHHPDLPALRDALAALERRNDVRVSRLDEFLAAAADDLATGGMARQALATVTGELRWSYGYTWTLQGVHATRAPQKRRNSELELLLERAAEPLAALARVRGARDEAPLLASTWRRLVECHFHDAIAGCAADEVARAVDARFDAVEGAASEVARRALYSLAGHDPDRARAAAQARSEVEASDGSSPALLLWNPAARPRGGIVVADLSVFRRDIRVGPPAGPSVRGEAAPAGGDDVGVPGALRIAGGAPLPVQILERARALERVDAPHHYPDLDEVERVRVAFEAPELAGLATLRLESLESPVPRPTRELHRRGRTLANRFVEVTVSAHGGLAVTDRLTGEQYEGLLAWEGEDDIGDTYTPCPAPDGGVVHPAGEARVRDLADGPFVAALEIRTALAMGRAAAGEGSGWADIRMVVVLFADDPVIRVRTELVNAARDHRLRLRFPLGLPGGTALAGAAFGTERRDPVVVATEVPMEAPVRTAPAHRFVAAAEGMRGLALFAPGFFEYEWTPAGELVFTALRATGALSRGDLPTRPGHAGWTVPTPAAQCLGSHRFDLAFTPAGAGALDRPDELMALWEDCFLPIRGEWLRRATAAEPGAAVPSVELEGAGLVMSAVKPAEDGQGMVLRCCNLLGRPAAGTWRFGWPLEAAWRARMDEREREPLVLPPDRRTLRFTAPAHDTVTMIIQ